MGQSKLKAVRKEERQAHKGAKRLQSIKIEGQIIAYDEHGRAKIEGTAQIESFFVMEAEIPAEVVALIRKKYPKLEFEFVDPDAPKPESA